MTRYLPRFLTGLRARLVVGFLAVVTIALILVFATLPGLLNGYFEQQTKEDLDRACADGVAVRRARAARLPDRAMAERHSRSSSRPTR